MKVLIIITTAFVPYGGLSTVVMNYYRAIDKTSIHIDIASNNTPPKVLLDELKKNGSTYYNLGKRKDVMSYFVKLYRVLKNGYDVVHVNGNSATMVLELFPAKLRHVPMRIAHVHTTKTEHPFINRLSYPLFKKTYTKALAVSEVAGNNLFHSDYMVLNNAIDVSKYVYSDASRTKIRELLGLNEEFVIGNVGKLNYSKNQEYLLKVFARLVKKTSNVKLLLVGGGNLEQDLVNQCNDLGIRENVIFTGMVDDASLYIYAMDFFVFPSRYEGFALALLEAQASGLKCLISDTIPHEAVVTENVKVMSLDGNYDEWAKYIIENRSYDRKQCSDEAALSIRKKGFDITIEADRLAEIYADKK